LIVYERYDRFPRLIDQILSLSLLLRLRLLLLLLQAQVRMLQVRTRTRRALAIRRADELAELRAEAERVRRLEFRTVGAARVLQRLWRTATLWETARTFVDLSVRRRREKMRNW